MNGEQILEKVITEVFSPIYQAIVGVAFLYFLYGVVMFIINMNDPEKKNTGKQHLLWGTVGLFIMLSVGGLLQLLNSILDGMFVF